MNSLDTILGINFKAMKSTSPSSRRYLEKVIPSRAKFDKAQRLWDKTSQQVSAIIKLKLDSYLKT